ncbi:immediate early protein [Streptomyces sp. 796.1]|uniref:immediate early protein n=1 Tax=Streptomyces sp. 796.1 TaxID=3163029 RepID=UPI0039C9F1D3
MDIRAARAAAGAANSAADSTRGNTADSAAARTDADATAGTGTSPDANAAAQGDAAEGDRVNRDAGHGEASGPATAPDALSHQVLKSLLGAWALAACSADEIAAVDRHLDQCTPCSNEAERLRRAVGLLHTEENLDLDPRLRSRVLAGCLGRRPARIPVPEWAAPYDAETARLDALISDMGEAEWRAPVPLRWYDGVRAQERDTTVAGVIGHLLAVDGIVAGAVGLPDPLGPGAPASPLARTEAYWRDAPAHLARLTRRGTRPAGILPRPTTRPARPDPARPAPPRPGAVREPWRRQGHALVRTVSFAARGTSQLSVPYGEFALPLRDSFLDRAFECWVHAGDIAEAVDYPYDPPAAAHLHLMIDLCARLLPRALAERRQCGLASPPRHLDRPGTPSRSLHLEIEGHGGGHWYIALDSPTATPAVEEQVAHIALDREEFCQLVAGHVPPLDAAAGQVGDPEAIRDVLRTAASLSRL